MSLQLSEAQVISQQIVDAISPFCAEGRCKVAGSIRRKRPVVNDIDIVLRPFDRSGLQIRCKERCDILAWGDCLAMLKTRRGIRIDLFFTQSEQRNLFNEVVTPDNWGIVLLGKTGSKEFNQRLCIAAAARGLHFNPQWGLYAGGKCHASKTEEEVFSALGMEFIEPQNREV